MIVESRFEHGSGISFLQSSGVGYRSACKNNCNDNLVTLYFYHDEQA